MNPYTYRDLIRKYSADVAHGHADTDLTARQRRITVVMLNLASNAGRADVPYPPDPDRRNDAVGHLADIMWEARALVFAVSPGAAVATDLDIAHTRALDILRNI